MPWAAIPTSDPPAELNAIADVLDPVLTPLGFTSGQLGADTERGQVIFCRGWIDSVDDACVDLVLDVEAHPAWRIVDVRYSGFASDRWHLVFDSKARLPDQLTGLARSLPTTLA